MTTPPEPVPEGELDAVIEAERTLLDPDVRADRASVEALLHLAFTEIGASGRLWRRDEIIDAIATNPQPAPEASAFEAVTIAPDTVLLTYACTDTHRTLRSSIWQRVDGAWKIRFHQGTVTGPPNP